MAPRTRKRPLPPKVGHFACPVGEGRLVRVGWSDPFAKQPRVRSIERCPACGDRHAGVTLFWRPVLERDEGTTPELVLEPLADDEAAEDE